VDGFPTAGGRNPPSALAKSQFFGMLLSRFETGSSLPGGGLSRVMPSGNRRLSFYFSRLSEKYKK
jgi:hypothetical protein